MQPKKMGNEALELVHRFKNARKILGISQKDAGKIIGKSQKQVSDYETGVSAPSEQIVYLLENTVTQEFGVDRSKELIIAALHKHQVNSIPVLPNAYFLCNTLGILADMPIHEALQVNGFNDWLEIIIQKTLNKRLHKT